MRSKKTQHIKCEKNGILLKTKRSFSWIDLEIIIETLEKTSIKLRPLDSPHGYGESLKKMDKIL